MPQPPAAPLLVRWLCKARDQEVATAMEAWSAKKIEEARARQEASAKERAEQQAAARARVQRKREKISVRDGMLESELLSAEDFLALIQSLEPKELKSPQVIPKVGWNHYNGVPDGSVSINTYTDCETEYGNLTIREYYEEWEHKRRYSSWTKIYASSDDLMRKIVDIMKGTGRFTSVGERRPRESAAAYEERKKGELF